MGSYNVPEGNEANMLGEIGYSPEQVFSESGEPTSFVRFAAGLEGMELEQCVNSTMCHPQKPKLVVGLKGSTANTFVDNGAYRDFLYKTFEVSSADMESSAIVMTSLSNGFPVIVIRGISDLAGKQSGDNVWSTFGSLAALNCAKAVLQFIRKLKLPQDSSAGC
ncbi:Phosphorylase superfamily protein [Tripterygium wilfordii]|uniref:Phosphorylase superfamily protein n=1 Tax=Tripterygium wilfordii TaxID=458696 RepID=A0A7J7D8A7_TRIWF|nr:Phosphorylase superfamily protein [Tripterygium wilfordii]